MNVNRCAWSTSDPLYVKYHDEEWGTPIRGNDNKLFEFLILEGAQAGLSWITILRKRENYRAAFDNFDPVRSPPTTTPRSRSCWKIPASSATG